MSQHLFQSYFRDLDALRMVGADTENQLRPAFERLLADYARSRNLVFVPEVPMKAVNGKNTIRPDGVVKGLNRMDWGYWEAKDEKDDLDDEIRTKIAKGYPLDNIIFDDTRKAVLYQAGVRVLEIDMSDKEALQSLLERFFTFERPEYTAFREALEAFHADVPPIVAELRELLAKTARENPDFVSSREEFLKVCQASINTEVSMEDVNEMLLQHVLTEDIFTTIFDDADFHHANNIARELVSVLDTFFRGAVKRNVLARIRPYYEAIRAAASRIADYREKQTFLKAVYEDFYKAYNPKAADRLGVVYTPHEIVRFMIHATDELLHSHFGKDLLASGVDILDPATGTGTFICDLLEYFPTSRKEQIRHKYLHELHANEVSILPYYIANLNIEYVFQQKTGEYREFPNLCFVDTLDNTGFGFAGQQGDMFGSLSAENAARVKRQNERNIAVVIGNPPYNANQQNENDNNKNRTYREVDKRIKDTYIAASTAQKTKLYDMYARFFRWASDRLAANGIVAFICNRSFIESRTFDGFRKCVAEEFSDIYIVDTRSDVRANPRIAGTTHNVFGIQTGVAVVFLVRKGTPRLAALATPLSAKAGNVLEETPRQSSLRSTATPLSAKKGNVLPSSETKSGVARNSSSPREGVAAKRSKADGVASLARIHYFTLTDEQTRKEKLEWFATTAFGDIPFERITPDDRHTWLNQTDNDFDTLLPLCSKDVKSGKAKTGAVFELFANGIKTNRDEWVYDFDKINLEAKCRYLVDRYNQQVKGGIRDNDSLDYSIKWSRDLKNKMYTNSSANFNAENIVRSLWRPFTRQFYYKEKKFSDVLTENHVQIFGGQLTQINDVINLSGLSPMKPFQALASNIISDYEFVEKNICLPLYRYENGERRENITEWGLQQFRARYGQQTPRQSSLRLTATPLLEKEGNVLVAEETPRLASLATPLSAKEGNVFSSPEAKALPNNSPSLGEGVSDKRSEADGVVLRFREKHLSLPSNPALKQRARELRKAGVLSEVLFWNQVKNEQIFGLDFDRQRVIGHYIVDFYIKRLGIVVEIDGSSHDDKAEYDAQRDEYLQALGIDVVHYTDVDVKKNLAAVIADLKAFIVEKFTVVEETPRLASLATPLSAKAGNFSPSPLAKAVPYNSPSLGEGVAAQRSAADGVVPLVVEETPRLASLATPLSAKAGNFSPSPLAKAVPYNSPSLGEGVAAQRSAADGVVPLERDITKEDIFHYVYAVLHCPHYRRKYEQNLKRDFPRVPFYADFAEWAAWGRELMRLHVDYENVEPFALEREDKPLRAGTPLPLKSKLKADKAAGTIAVDESTTLGGIPAEAWEYKLGNRSALEWVCDQYRDYTPSDPTIREKFHTYRFADHKEQVIALLQRVCRVSVETVRITRAMEACAE